MLEGRRSVAMSDALPSHVRRNFRQLLEYDEYLGHKYIPKQRACIQYGDRHYFVETDSIGFRNSPRRSPGALRIVVLSDSYTDGYGVTNEERFTDRLRKTTIVRSPTWQCPDSELINNFWLMSVIPSRLLFGGRRCQQRST